MLGRSSEIFKVDKMGLFSWRVCNSKIIRGWGGNFVVPKVCNIHCELEGVRVGVEILRGYDWRYRPAFFFFYLGSAHSCTQKPYVSPVTTPPLHPARTLRIDPARAACLQYYCPFLIWLEPKRHVPVSKPDPSSSCISLIVPPVAPLPPSIPFSVLSILSPISSWETLAK